VFVLACFFILVCFFFYSLSVFMDHCERYGLEEDWVQCGSTWKQKLFADGSYLQKWVLIFMMGLEPLSWLAKVWHNSMVCLSIFSNLNVVWNSQCSFQPLYPKVNILVLTTSTLKWKTTFKSFHYNCVRYYTILVILWSLWSGMICLLVCENIFHCIFTSLSPYLIK